MKKIIMFISIILSLSVCMYFLGKVNIYLGSNSRYFVTAFDYDDSVWYSKEYNIKAQVYDEEEYVYMILTDINWDEKYILLCLNDFHAELYEGDDIKSCMLSKPICKIVVDSEKKWGEIYKFSIRNITLNSKHYQKNIDNMVFLRQDR